MLLYGKTQSINFCGAAIILPSESADGPQIGIRAKSSRKGQSYGWGEQSKGEGERPNITQTRTWISVKLLLYFGFGLVCFIPWFSLLSFCLVTPPWPSVIILSAACDSVGQLFLTLTNLEILMTAV